MEYIIMYSNCKMYSKTIGKYVTLDYIRDVIINGQRDVVVLDQKTSADVTSLVLGRIVARLHTELGTIKLKDLILFSRGLKKVS